MPALTRVAKNAAATLTHTFYVGETPTDPTGTPTYAIVDANGTAVSSGNATVVGGGTGQVTAALAAQSALKRLTVTWTATISGGTVVEVDTVEIVGGFFFGLAEGRASDSSLSSTSTYPTAMLTAKRLEVEIECEMICDRAFVPRYDRAVLNGTGTSQLLLQPSEPDRSAADIRTIRRISIAPDLDETFTDLTAGQLASVAWDATGQLTRTDGNVFYEGRRNIIVEWEYGLDAPVSDLQMASLTRFRTRLNLARSGIPDRAQSYTDPDGGSYRLTLPAAYSTGIPEVDAVYARYSRRSNANNGSTGNGHAVPASRTLSYNVQRYSMFHGR